jgi:hypothetical protein
MPTTVIEDDEYFGGRYKIYGLSLPSRSDEAVNKRYVDDLIAVIEESITAPPISGYASALMLMGG